MDLKKAIGSVDLHPLQFEYGRSLVRLQRPRNSFQIRPDQGPRLRHDGRWWHLDRMDFHMPSEHHIDSQPFDMEIQFIHRDDQGKSLVLAVLVNEGTRHEEAARLVTFAKGATGDDRLSLTPGKFLPKKRDYFLYPGSMTVPPCQEGIRWLVLARPVTLSPDQLDAVARYTGRNARPLQAMASRVPLRSR